MGESSRRSTHTIHFSSIHSKFEKIRKKLNFVVDDRCNLLCGCSDRGLIRIRR